MAAVLLGSVGIASANEPPPPVVIIQYVISEQLPERGEQTVANPLERALLKLDRVARVNTRTGHGIVDAEIHFEGGATEKDLATVTQQIAQLKFGSEVLVTSNSIHLGPPRLH